MRIRRMRRADHVSLFPSAAVLAQCKDKLTGFKTSRGTVQFPLDNRLPIALIKRIVNTRLPSTKRSLGGESHFRNDRERMPKAVSGGVVHDLPEDLRKALRSDPKALAIWEDLTPLARNEWICWVVSVKKAETRREHVERVCSELHDGMRRPCCFIGCIHRSDKPLSPSQEFILGRRSKK